MATRQRLSLRDAGVSLIDCVHKTPPAADAGYPYIAIPQIKDGRIEFQEARRISAEDFLNWTRKAMPEPYDVVLSRRCNPGETAWVPPDFTFALGQNLVLLRASGDVVYPPFLRWLVRSPEWWSQIQQNLNVGAVFDSLKCADVPNFKLPIPPLADQRAIANILGALDDKIELNRKMSATLEAIARALFKSWFVDFDPVHAKAEGRDPGLPAEIAALFPDSFGNKGSRPIPMGWAITRLDDFANISGGKQLPTHECKKSGQHQVFGANGVMGYADRYTHDSFVAAFGRVGANCGSIHWTYEPSWINNNASAIAPERYPEYVLQTLLNIDFVSMRTGSAQPFIPNSSLAAAPILRAPNELISEFCSMAGPMRLKQGTLDAESRTLAALRDALLPKLISGELRVGEGERVLAASA